MQAQVDPAASTPLYAQIADRIEYAIATGRLAPGEALPSLREAQDQWKVNLHTVRHAYRELEKMGLVKIQHRVGAVVLPRKVTAGHDGLRSLVTTMLAEAERRFGAEACDVVREIESAIAVASTPRVCVVECSATLCDAIAAQIASEWNVETTSHVIGDGAVPAGAVVSTYFHYREVKSALVDRPDDLAFVRIQPAARFLDALREAVRSGRAESIVLCETDPSIGRDLAAELRHALGGDVKISVETPADVLGFVSRSDPSVMKVISPRNWDRLGDRAPLDSMDRSVLLLEYDADAEDLRGLGARFGWREK